MKLSSLLKSITPTGLYGIRAEFNGQIVDIKGAGPRAPSPMHYDLSPDPEIGSVHYRTQDVKPGGLFVAIQRG